MKYWLILLALSWSSADTSAQVGIDFFEGSWKDALAKAQKANKPIFLDAYTTLCGTCKQMNTDVFTNAEVADFFNANFINVKMDMEKGEGLDMAKKWSLEMYPTLFFFDASGTNLHQATGFHETSDFLELGEIALNPDKNLQGMVKRYANGDRKPSFLFDYAIAAAHAMTPNSSAIADAYLSTQSNWSTPENLEFIYNFMEKTDSKMFDYFIDHRKDFEAQLGKEQVMMRLQDLIIKDAFTGADNADTAFSRIATIYQRINPESAPSLLALFKMNYYRQAGMNNEFAQSAVDYFNLQKIDDPAELNNIAWNFVENVTDINLLSQALTWAERSVAIDRQAYNLDTLAWLNFKLGNKSKAKKIAKEAMKLAKSRSEDTSSSEELLKQL
jgi:thioredoxin-related protein